MVVRVGGIGLRVWYTQVQVGCVEDVGVRGQRLGLGFRQGITNCACAWQRVEMHLGAGWIRVQGRCLNFAAD